MNTHPLGIDMREATRLTRAGQLHEALALLRGTAPVQPGPTGERAAGDILDMAPPSAATGGAWTAVPASDPGPPGAFVRRAYRGAHGSRTYMLYVPAGHADRPLPLVVMLHGCTQSADDFAAGTRMNALADELGLVVAYPEQPRSANTSKCWNWFNRRDQQRDAGEPALLAGITREVARDGRVDAARVYVAGLSAGGAAAAILGSVYPDLYAAIGVHSGLACGAAQDVPSAFAAMRQGGSAPTARTRPQGAATRAVPTIVFHGDGDTTVSPVNGEHVITQSGGTPLQTTVEHGRSATGMAYTRTVHGAPGQPTQLEHWLLHGAGHAWSGGSAEGSYTEPRGPDASREMLRFFLQHATPGGAR